MATATTKRQRQSFKQGIKREHIGQAATQADRINQAWAELNTTGKTWVPNYGIACDFKRDYDEVGKHDDRKVYLTELDRGYEVRVVHEPLADQPKLSPVEQVVALAEEWGCSVDELHARKDSMKAGAGSRVRQVEYGLAIYVG